MSGAQKGLPGALSGGDEVKAGDLAAIRSSRSKSAARVPRLGAIAGVGPGPQASTRSRDGSLQDWGGRRRPPKRGADAGPVRRGRAAALAYCVQVPQCIRRRVEGQVGRTDPERQVLDAEWPRWTRAPWPEAEPQINGAILPRMRRPDRPRFALKVLGASGCAVRRAGRSVPTGKTLYFPISIHYVKKRTSLYLRANSPALGGEFHFFPGRSKK